MSLMRFKVASALARAQGVRVCRAAPLSTSLLLSPRFHSSSSSSSSNSDEPKQTFSFIPANKRHTQMLADAKKNDTTGAFERGVSIPGPFRYPEEIAEDQKKAERAEKMKGVEKIEYEDEDPDMVMTYNDKTGEFSGPRGPEPTRHGDYSFKGRCSDF